MRACSWKVCSEMSSDYRWTAAANDDGIKLAGNTQAGQRRIGDQRQGIHA
jgi:hypothetical protein